MPRSPACRLPQPLRAAARELPALLLCAAVAATIAARATAATGSGVDTYSFPTFDAATTDAFVVATNSSLLVPASLLFLPERLYPEFNRSEGFLLLSQTVAFWRERTAGAGVGGGAAPPTADRREASFNTSFTLRGAAPVAFTVLLDRFPPFNGFIGLGLRGNADANGSVAAAAANASSTLAAVEVGAVRSYGPDAPNVGLNITVTPGGAARMSRAVWIEYDAAAHRLSVRVAGAGEARPPGALLDVPVNLVERGTTQTAFVGFFAAAVSNTLVGVSGWELTVDRFLRGGKKGTSWLVILLAVLGSVAAAAIVSAVVWCFLSRRRKLNDTEPKI